MGGLRDLAERDLRAILHDKAGFSWPLHLRNPEGADLALCGFSNDVEQTIDRDTGLPIVGREAHVTIAMRDVLDFGEPQGINNATRKPWVVIFDDILGRSQTFKVKQALPDRALGVIVCFLETYVDATS